MVSRARIGVASMLSIAAAVLLSTGCGSSGSADGRYLAFDSNATHLVPGDTNDEWDVFVRDRVEGSTERVSVGRLGRQSNGESGLPSIGTDGRVVAFWSDATNLVAGDTNGERDVFVYDRSTEMSERVSVGGAGAQANGKSTGPYPALSADGRYVAFESLASNLVEGDTNGGWDVFVRDRVEGTTERISQSGTEDNGAGDGLALSADGRYVAFQSSASNLVEGDANGGWDVFVRDRVEGTTERISQSGTQDNGRSHGLALSADGRYVAFQSSASNLVERDANHLADVFVRDREKGTTERVSVGAGSKEGAGESGFPSLSADGRYVAFESEAPNLVEGDTNGEMDVFVRDRVDETTELASVPDSSTGGHQVMSDAPSLSARGRYVMFWSGESNERGWEVFVRDLRAGTTELVSAPMPAARAGSAVVTPSPAEAGGRVTVSVPITVDGGPASSGTVVCSASVLSGTAAVVADAPLRPSGRGYRDGAAECRWRLPSESAGKTVRGLVTATTPNGRVWRRFESSIAGRAGAVPGPGARAGTVLFTRSTGGRKPDLFVVAPDGSQARLFVRDASGAAVSRDGRRILFVRGGAIWVMRRDGSGRRPVTRPPGSARDWDPAWSPDGRGIYFSRAADEGGGYAIFRASVDGTRLRRLTSGCRDCSVGGQDEAAPSSDGRIVAYTSYYHGGGEDSAYISAVTRTGGRADLPFATTSASHELAPAWAPNGRMLAFEALDADALYREESQVGLSGIYVSAAGAASPRRVARPNRDAWKHVGDPAWSADGRWIAFVQEHPVGYVSAGNIWIVRVGGNALRRLTGGNTDAREPTWLPPER